MELGQDLGHLADPSDPNLPASNPAANLLRLLHNTVDGIHVNPTYDGRGQAIQMRAYGMEAPHGGSRAR